MNSGKTMLITGCSGGLGKALALAASAAGYQVIATARKPQDLAALQALGLNVLALDLCSAASVAAAVQQLKERGTGLDVLVNNAGFGAIGAVLDASPEQMRRQFDTNVFAVAELTQACLPLLLQQQGLVVNIGSVSARLTTPFAGWYCASKAALHCISDAMRMELAPLGVRVLTVQAGAIATGFADNAQAGVAASLTEQSLWWRFRRGIEKRANASRQHPTSAEKLSQQLLSEIAKPGCTGLVRLGNGAVLLALLQALMPRTILDKVLQKKFALR
ncbi:SDR family oxidoreductase [Rheinheimera sp.]|uniref:SDR family oxidoreductase n=1 Tax=Rheinheimera sp. TaxID=1869214 RepID=UPI00307CCF8B